MLADGIGAAAKEGLRHVPPAALVSSYTTCPCVRRAEEHSHRVDTYHLNPRQNDPARPMPGIRVAHRVATTMASSARCSRSISNNVNAKLLARQDP
jgi:hypothetical protein